MVMERIVQAEYCDAEHWSNFAAAAVYCHVGSLRDELVLFYAVEEPMGNWPARFDV